MGYRKDQLIDGECYHICTKSIAGYKIFNNDEEFLRMMGLLQYYQFDKMPVRFSHFVESITLENFTHKLKMISQGKDKIVKIIAFCLMPTHIHCVLQQSSDSGIARFMANVLIGYSKYFNLRHNRKGPLWEGRFRSIFIKDDDQLLHLTRYLHLNPTSAGLIHHPEDWRYSSYRQYIDLENENCFCEYQDKISVSQVDYRKFVEDRMAYQKELEKIKHVILE